MKKVIALGFFDGVHLGHGALLKRTVAVAREGGMTPAAFTFLTHPGSVIEGTPTPLLTTPADRAELMERLYGVSEVIEVPFDQAMRTMPWDKFITDYLARELGAAHLVAGHDYRFGYRGEGDAHRLRDLCARLGLGCDIIPRVELDGVTVSSTYIRDLVAAGEVEEAGRFLGHPHSLTGRVEHGKKLGSRLGFPTVNLVPDARLLLPAYGVYVARAVLPGGRSCPAVSNVGVRPTVEEAGTVTVESFLLDFEGDLYAQDIRLEFCRRLRPERRFGSLEELQQAVTQDVQAARAYFHSM